MDHAEFEHLKAELIADCQRAMKPLVFGKVNRSAALDRASAQMAEFVGQPCIARWEGERIVISWPVINRRAIS